jgi:surface antigen/peptidoglycan hydrolase CwlO-like protein
MKIMRYIRSTPILFILSIFVIFLVFIVVPLVRADSFQSQINALNQQNAQLQASADALKSSAQSYQAQISQLQTQISSVQNAIYANSQKQIELNSQIAQDQAELVRQRSVLSNDIKTMYFSDQLTPVEMLATSSSLSQYVDQRVAYQAIQDKIQNIMTQISREETNLNQQKNQLSIVLNIEKMQNNQLTTTQNQLRQLLSYNQSQQASYNQAIQNNQSKLATLTAEQIAANRQLVNRNGGKILTSGTCGGGYPASATGINGSWGCDYPHTPDNIPGCSNMDPWGMCNRECVSYTAWMVYSTYGINVTGFGNANQWVAAAQSAGIPTGTTPKVGSVAIYMGGAGDHWGHAMWVAGVNGNQIIADQYNLYYDGNFYQTQISSAGLIYIYFGS